LRWNYFFYEIIKAGYFSNGSNLKLIDFGGSFGVPIFLDPYSRHEIRIGIGIDFLGTISNAVSNTASFALVPSISYVWHATEHISLYSIFESYCAIEGFRGFNSPTYPFLLPMFSIGFKVQ